MTQYRPRGTTASEITDDVEAAVRAGRLEPGDRLPPVRGLATDLRVSPGTVAAAYTTLRARGVVVTDGRRGTHVARRPPVAAAPDRDRFARTAVPDGVLDLANGSPDPALLPDLGPALARQARQKRTYGERAVESSLSAAGGAWLASDGIRVDALTVVSGAMDGVERVLTAWLSPGDRVVVEDPGYAAVLDLVAVLGLMVEPVAIDDEGPEPAAFARAIRGGAAAAVITPRAQNPTGAALSRARAQALRKALDRHRQVLVIEDDHAGPVAGLDAVTTIGDGKRPRWAVIRSVAKALGPDLRCALVAGDPATIARVEGRLSLGPGWVSGLLQGTVAELLDRAGTATLFEKAARTYGRRRHALLQALASHGVQGARGASGLNVWVPVPDEAAAVSQLLADHIAVAAGSRYRVASPPAIRITVSSLPTTDAPTVAASVARAISRTNARLG